MKINFVRVNIQNKVLLFDFDGTLVETEILAQEVIDLYFSKKNFPSPVHFGDLIIGRTWGAATEVMVEYAAQRGVVLPHHTVLKQELLALYRLQIEKGVKLIPGLEECLPHFKSQAKFIGIVTGSDHDEVSLILKSHGLDQYFDRIWAVGDYEKSKPDPSPYLQAIEDLNANPSEVLVFEDSKAGMESANRAGLKWIQVAYESHAKEADPRSLLTIHHWNEIWTVPKVK